MSINKNELQVKVAEYFSTDLWKNLITVLERGDEVYHVHTYADTTVHPSSLARIVEGYFEKKGWELERKINIIPLPGAKEMADVYCICPRGKAYFEIILNLSPDVILQPAGGNKLDVWDEEYMKNFYGKFNLKREVSKEEEDQIRQYFKSGYWELGYEFAKDPRHCHSHLVIETSVHPLTLMKYAQEAIETTGFSILKTASIVYGYGGKETPKIVFLLKPPGSYIELEWHFNPDVVIGPRFDPFIFLLTEDMLKSDMERLDFLVSLGDKEIEEIIDNIQP